MALSDMRALRALGAASIAVATLLTACGPDAAPPAEEPAGQAQSVALELWTQGQPAFGVYVPDERPREDRVQDGQRMPAIYTAEGARRLAANPLYDFLFLNLEGAYDVEAVRTLVGGMEATGVQKTLLVRIPPISDAGEGATAARVAEILALGADGIVLPHIRSLEEAQTAIGFFETAGADVWTPDHTTGHVAAMLMVEDPEAVGQASQIAGLGGFSLLACGIGSLTQALGGDREAAEAGNQAVLAHATQAGLPDMITANAESIEGRLADGFLGLLMQGPTADDVIMKGLIASGRATP